MKQISENGIRLIKSFEGCHLTTYDDLQPKVKLTPNTPLKGTLTIGWGHTGSDVWIGKTITQKEADDLFLQDIQRYVNYVNNEAYVSFTKRLNQNQFDALVSFCYNCGPGNLKKLCYLVNMDTVPLNIVKYNKSKGQELLGLVRRRQAEKELFLKPETAPTPQKDKPEPLTIEQRIALLEKDVSMLVHKNETIPVPDWAIEEFPNLLDYINTKTGTHDFWRNVIVTLRIFNSKKVE